jgi:hypothetical protein
MELEPIIIFANIAAVSYDFRGVTESASVVSFETAESLTQIFISDPAASSKPRNPNLQTIFSNNSAKSKRYAKRL